MRLLAVFLLLPAITANAQRVSYLRDRQIHDDDTRAWWHTTEVLAGDSMEGRDTGSPGYQRAAAYVAERFRKAALKPAGGHGDFLQTVPMHEVSVESASFAIVRADGKSVAIPFLEQITVSAAPGMPTDLDAELTFRGYCGKDAMEDADGKIIVCFGTQRAGLPGAAERLANARAARAAGVLTVDDPSFTVEPPRWPQAYARNVALVDPQARSEPPAANSPVAMRLASASFAAVIDGSSKDAEAVLGAGGRQAPLASFAIPAHLRVHLQLAERAFSSPNVLALLPGSDPALKDEVLVLSAHLDGYGYGTPVGGDRLYNGALDDAAYVALLIQYADDLRRSHTRPRRSILFCAFTGEEKGLLGAKWFVAHPTVAKQSLVADINLDQLRPLFPLHLLTAPALGETSLGAAARQAGAVLGIRLQEDPEPERNLLRRADHYPFLQAGVPAIGFIFGYEPGTEAERRYREWYQVRYHRPQDDLTQPLDFEAAAKFNQFFYKLCALVADGETRPAFTLGSGFAPATK